MAFAIEEFRASIDSLCRQFGVIKLELFGSATREDFDALRSDVDFLVEFDMEAIASGLRQYMGFKFALEELFGRSVDLVEAGALKNPYFIQRISTERRLIYAA